MLTIEKISLGVGLESGTARSVGRHLTGAPTSTILFTDIYYYLLGFLSLSAMAFIGHPHGDYHIRIIMEHSVLLSVWYHYFMVFCYFFRSRNLHSAHPLIVSITFQAELGYFSNVKQAIT